MTAPVALAIFLLAAQQPIAQPGANATTPAQHDPEPGRANRDALQMLTTGNVKFALLDSRGKEHKASLVRVDGNNAVLRSHGADHSIPVDQLRRFERPADRRWDGALIGFGVGLGLAALVGAGEAAASLFSDAPNPPHSNSNGTEISLICISTAIGYAIDAAHGRKHTLFVGTMPATSARSSALAVGVVGHGRDRGLQASYRLAF
jgi:hypothetical protein